MMTVLNRQKYEKNQLTRNEYMLNYYLKTNNKMMGNQIIEQQETNHVCLPREHLPFTYGGIHF